MERIEYFDKPAQVKFRDFKGEECYGIAFKDTIICGCCGSAFEAGENDGLWFVCPECGEPILFEDWVDDKELADGCCPICGERWF